MFNYLRKSPFLDANKFLFQAFQQEINFEKQLQIGLTNYVKKHANPTAF